MENQSDYIDEERYNEIKSVMGDKFPQFLESYTENTDMHLEKAGEYLAANDLDSVYKNLHPIISTSAALGLMQVTDLAIKINTAIEEDEAKKAIIEQQYQELVAIYNDAKPYL